jgi:hypothetical protein
LPLGTRASSRRWPSCGPTRSRVHQLEVPNPSVVGSSFTPSRRRL